MNRLQGIKSEQEFCVTLNPTRGIEKDKIIKEFIYHHPIFDLAAIETQKNLNLLQNQNNKFFCGSYFGYGFHEDAVRSAVNVAKILGVDF